MGDLAEWIEAVKAPPRHHDCGEPVAAWTEPELLEGEPVKAYVAVMRTRGCHWSITSGCSMCGYFNDTVPGGVKEPELRQQWAKVMAGRRDQPLVKLYTSGSFLDERELPAPLQREILSQLAGAGVARVVVESLPEFVTRRRLDSLVKAAGGVKLEVALGLESADERVLGRAINKKLTRKGFARAVAALLESEVLAKAYVLLKPPFLAEAAAIADALAAIRFAMECGCTAISLNPVNIQRNTLVESLWKHGEYHPPWLWSVVEVLRHAQPLPDDVRLYSDPTGGGSRRGAHNCGKCNDTVLKAVKAHRLGDTKALELAIAEGCDCRSAWEGEVALGPFMRGGWGVVDRGRG